MTMLRHVRFDRRGFLHAASAAALAAGLPRVSLAAAPTDRRFVVVVLRGAMDGLAAVPPYADPDYRATRGSLALAAPGKADGMLDLDGFYGLHPALQPLHDSYIRGELAVIHAVATPYRDRSHFDGQDLLENGTVTPHASDNGWLNRALGLMGGDRTLGLAVGQSVPLILRGSAKVTSWAPSRLPEVSPDFLDKVADLYRRDPVFGAALAAGMSDQALVDKVLDQGTMDQGAMDQGMMAGAAMEKDGATAGAEALRRQAVALIKKVTGTVGKLLADPAGPRVAVIDVPGWDTHANQGTTAGRLAPVLKALGEGLAEFAPALGPAWRETAVLTLTEFGRTAAVNGTAGTDHGTASAAFLLGGAVHGGRVIADWPGLSRAKLYQGRDLAPTTDTRAICKALLRDHLGLPADAIDRVVFPGSGEVRAMAELIAV
jgi:uncharacterized protein (DUF1501 family)